MLKYESRAGTLLACLLAVGTERSLWSLDYGELNLNFMKDFLNLKKPIFMSQ